jgi:hypothetical protein
MRAAIRTLQARHCGESGLTDRKTGVVTRYLFMYRGRLLSEHYLFESALEKACQTAGLVAQDGKPTDYIPSFSAHSGDAVRAAVICISPVPSL